MAQTYVKDLSGLIVLAGVVGVVYLWLAVVGGG